MTKTTPKVILFQEDEKALNYRYKLNYTPKNSIEVKSLEYDAEDFKNSFKIIGNSPDYNSVYFLHPFKKDVYVNEDQGEEYFLKEKLDLYTKAASLLGARNISSKVTIEESKSLETDINGEIKYKVISAGVDVNTKEENKYKNTLKINEEFELQDNFDKNKNIHELREIIRNYNLYHEQDLLTLIDSRDSSKTGTLLKKRSVKSEITLEFNQLLEISAQLNSPVFSLSSSYKSKLEKINKITVELEFNF